MRKPVYGRCDECRRSLHMGHGWDGRPMPAADYGASHFFCDPCLTDLELTQSVLLGEIDSVEELNEQASYEVAHGDSPRGW